MVLIRRVLTTGRCGGRGHRTLDCSYSLMQEVVLVWKGSEVCTGVCGPCYCI